MCPPQEPLTISSWRLARVAAVAVVSGCRWPSWGKPNRTKGRPPCGAGRILQGFELVNGPRNDKFNGRPLTTGAACPAGGPAHTTQPRPRAPLMLVLLQRRISGRMHHRHRPPAHHRHMGAVIIRVTDKSEVSMPRSVRQGCAGLPSTSLAPATAKGGAGIATARAPMCPVSASGAHITAANHELNGCWADGYTH